MQDRAVYAVGSVLIMPVMLHVETRSPVDLGAFPVRVDGLVLPGMSLYSGTALIGRNVTLPVVFWVYAAASDVTLSAVVEDENGPLYSKRTVSRSRR